MITTIIFDWGGVLAPADNEPTARILSTKYNLDFSYLKEKIGYFESQNSTSEDYSRFIEDMEREFKIPGPEVMQCFLDNPAGEGFQFAKSLNGKFKLCILSNQMHFKTQYIKETYDLSFFDSVLFSSEVGFKKPSSNMFNLLLERIGEVPKNCLFIDDGIDNVNAAKDLGFKAIQCTSVNNLKDQVNEEIRIAEDFLNNDKINTQ
jgi:HAD superfamily hydrolase (TIGR01549 family)